MHLHGNCECDFSHTHNGELGVVDPISNLLFTSLGIKNLFGKKKRAREGMEAQAKEIYTSQFPAGINWDRLLDMPNTNVIRGKQVTSRAAYNWMRGRNDSQLVKTNVATPEDYMAYVVQQWIGSSIGCDPNAKKGSQRYNLCPTFRDSGINIFDRAAVQKYYDAKKKPVPKPKPRAAPKPVAKLKVAPQVIPPRATAAPSGFMPQTGQGNVDLEKLFQIFSGRQAAAPQNITVAAPASAPKSALDKYLLPIALPVIAGITLFVMTKKKR